MGDRCETCGEDYTCRRCKCMRTDVTPPDDAPQTGTIVSRRRGAHPLYEYHEPMPTCSYFECEPGVWHPTDQKALAEMRDAIASKLFADRNGRQPGFLADQVMQTLGLTPPEPKEGGA